MLEGRTASSAPAAAFIPLGKLIPCDPGKSQVTGRGAAEKLDIFQGEAGGRRNAEVLEQIKGLTVNCEEVGTVLVNIFFFLFQNPETGEVKGAIFFAKQQGSSFLKTEGIAVWRWRRRPVSVVKMVRCNILYHRETFFLFYE